ncbi:MAG TPA: hypothetical protein VEJ84_08440 [Acidimicrobiales bacterium]|nr:hypothetical protein [Acidimicrobiales bacterium]
MGPIVVLATLRTAGALAGATLLGGLALVGATAQAASAAATGIVTGSVTSASSGAPLGGICVYAGTVTGTSGSLTSTGTTVMAVTSPSGGYQLNAPDGNNAVKFDPSCGGTVTSTYALCTSFRVAGGRAPGSGNTTIHRCWLPCQKHGTNSRCKRSPRSESARLYRSCPFSIDVL